MLPQTIRRDDTDSTIHEERQTPCGAAAPPAKHRRSLLDVLIFIDEMHDLRKNHRDGEANEETRTGVPYAE